MVEVITGLVCGFLVVGGMLATMFLFRKPEEKGDFRGNVAVSLFFGGLLATAWDGLVTLLVFGGTLTVLLLVTIVVLEWLGSRKEW